MTAISTLPARPPIDLTPMTSISFDREGNKIREHWFAVDLSPEELDLMQQKPCYRSMVCTHMPKGAIGRFMDGLMDAKLIKPFDMNVKAFDRAARSKVTFRIRYGIKGDGPFLSREAKAHMINLLWYLDDFKAPIIWKEGSHGYLIEPNGKIKRKWGLNPF